MSLAKGTGMPHRSSFSRYRHLRNALRDPDLSPAKRERLRERAKRVAATANANAVAQGLEPTSFRAMYNRDSVASAKIDKVRDSIYREELWRSHRANFLDSNTIRDENLASIGDSTARISGSKDRLLELRAGRRDFVRGDSHKLRKRVLDGSGPLSPHALRVLEAERSRLAHKVDEGVHLGSHDIAGREAHVAAVVSGHSAAADRLARVDARLGRSKG